LSRSARTAREAATLLLLGVVGDLQDFDRVVVLGQELVDSDDHLLTELDLTLEGGRRLGNLPLEPAALDPPDDATDRTDLGEQRFGFALELIRERFDEYEPPSGSITSATPVSWARICCVRRATCTDCSVGSASVSSSEFVCSDCVPPRTAASA